MRKIDLTGQKFGNLLVLKKDEQKMTERTEKDKKAYWICECQCYKKGIISVSTSDLKRGRKTHCQYCPGKNMDDLRGEKFGKLTPLYIDRDIDQSKKSQNRTYWMCQCDCGQYKSVAAYDLKRGHTKSCGCYNEKFKDLIKEKFGLLTVIEYDKEKSLQYKHSWWKCLCECGNIKSVSQQNLLKGSILSCGCKRISKGELKIKEILDKHQYSYEQEYSFKNKNLPFLRFDFAIFNNKNEIIALIEYQGKQHYEKIDYFGGKEKFLKQIENDNRKRIFCTDQKIPLIEIPYWDYEKISEDYILEKINNRR